MASASAAPRSWIREASACPLELDGLGLAPGFGLDAILFGLGLGLDLVFAGIRGLADVGLQLLLTALDLQLLDLDGLLLLHKADLGFLELDGLAQAVALELIGVIGLGLFLVDGRQRFGLFGFVLPLGLGDEGLGLQAGHFGFLAGLGGSDDGLLLPLGLGDGGVALGCRDDRFAEGVEIALGIGEFLERESQQEDAHAGELILGRIHDALVEFRTAPVDLLHRHRPDDFPHLALQDGHRHVADTVLAHA